MNWRLTLLLVAALALRLAIAPLPSYWVDEAFTIQLLDGGLGGAVADVVETESTPPLYFALAWLWTQATGLSELGLRSISALAGTATVGLVWALGRWLAGPRAALAAGALAAVNPFLLWFSTEARAYALATALTTGALVVLVRLLDGGRRDHDTAAGTGRRDGDRHDRGAAAGAGRHASDGDSDDRAGDRRLVAWAALAAGGLLTHYATIFVIAAQAGFLLYRRASRAAWAAVAAVAAVGLALVPLAVAQRGNDHAQSLDELGGSLAKRAAQLPKQFATGFDGPIETVAAVAALAVLAIGLALAVLAIPRPAPGRTPGPAPAPAPARRPRALGSAADGLRRRALVPLAVGAAGVLVPLAAAAIGLDVLSSRYLLPALPPLLAVAGAGLVAGPWRRVGPALAGVLAVGWLAVAVAVAADERLQTRADWQGVEKALGPAPAGGRAIVTSPSNGALVLTGAYRLPARYAPPRPVREVVLAATGEGTDAPPGIPPAAPGFAASGGFELAEQRVERGYVLQRWRAPAPRAVDPAKLARAALDPGRPSATLWQP